MNFLSNFKKFTAKDLVSVNTPRLVEISNICHGDCIRFKRSAVAWCEWTLKLYIMIYLST